MPESHGNRCGHDPQRPVLNAAKSIRKSDGGRNLPRILSLAAERAKTWYRHPAKCPPLQQGRNRKVRSERREAVQIVLEAILRRLDLASMCLGEPTLANGFIDIDMGTIVRDAGIGQRRCERAIGMLIRAGFMKSTQPRTQNDEGAYFGCRAIRVVRESLFEWLNLGPMLARERRRKSEQLARQARKANSKLSDFMRRLIQKTPASNWQKTRPADEEATRRWNIKCAEFFMRGLDGPEAKRRTNEALGFPPDYSPGHQHRP